MKKRLRPAVDGSFGPIRLVTETSAPLLQEILDLADERLFAACDFTFQDLEKAQKSHWGYRFDRMVNIDHHGDHKDWQRFVSSGNLAAQYVLTHRPVELVIINHTDCDSIISAGIACGLLEARADYEEAVVAADHTGVENPIADLLQALEHERDLRLSFDSLAALESGRALEDRAQVALARRHCQRVAARTASHNCVVKGRLACLELERNIASELVAPHLSECWAVAVAFPSAERSGTTELKLRLTSNAPVGFTLRRLDLSAVDPAYGGRWNAGSNKRGGGSSLKPAELLRAVAHKFHEAVKTWMFEGRNPPLESIADQR